MHSSCRHWEEVCLGDQEFQWSGMGGVQRGEAWIGAVDSPHSPCRALGKKRFASSGLEDAAIQSETRGRQNVSAPEWQRVAREDEPHLHKGGLVLSAPLFTSPRHGYKRH